VRIFDRGGRVPAEVVQRAGLPRGERVLADAEATDGTWLLGTRRLLVLVGDTSRLLPWEQVEDAEWDAEDSVLKVAEIGVYGEPQPSHAFTMDDQPALLLQLLRERVTASVVLQRRVPVRGRSGLTVIGRRSPVGGPIAWMHAYDADLDPDDPEVVAVAELALAQARAEVGDPGVGPI